MVGGVASQENVVKETKKYMSLVVEDRSRTRPEVSGDEEVDGTAVEDLDLNSPTYFSELAAATKRQREKACADPSTRPVGAWRCHVCTYENVPPARQTFYTDATVCGVMHPFQAGDEVGGGAGR